MMTGLPWTVAVVALFPLELVTTRVFPLADGVGVSIGMVRIRLLSLISHFIFITSSFQVTINVNKISQTTLPRSYSRRQDIPLHLGSS